MSPLSFPFPDLPAPGTATEVAPGVHWVRMTLPFKLDHVNLWLIEDDEGWTLVDCGYEGEDTRAAWDGVFATTLGGRPVRRIIVTHFHPDHMGLAGWQAERWQAPVWMTLAEWLSANFAWHGGFTGDAEGRARFYRGHGLEDDHIEAFRARGNAYRRGVPSLPGAFRRLHDGDEIVIGGRVWRVIVGEGHAPEHACLYCPDLGVLLAADQVLPKISPNVSVWHTEPLGNPLALFLRSLERFRPLPADTLVLPSHGRPFRGLHARLDDLAVHHEARLGEVLRACAEPRTARDLLPVLFHRELDLHQLGFAMGEALAHLHYLEGRGRLVREADARGVERFVLA